MWSFGLTRHLTSQGLATAALLAAATVKCQAVPPVVEESGVTAHLFDLSQVQLSDSRWLGNQDRTLTYLKDVDMERLLYVFRVTHGLSTNGAAPCGGWDAPDFPFRSHVQGHLLTAWAQCWATLRDAECRDRAVYFAEELAKCQANNAAAGFTEGYLSGFPESEIDAVINRTLTNGNVPWYAIHKTMAGLLDVWRHVGSGDETGAAQTALLGMADWTDARTGALTYEQMQTMMETEFGGMADIMTEVYRWTGEARYLEAAARFDHAAVLDPLASGTDSLSGLHANTQVPKWIGAVREYKQTGEAWYLDVARNAWDMTVGAHSYAIGGNSQAEHFRDPNAIAAFLDEDTCEACNSYNMLKLTRELWTLGVSEEGDGDGARTTEYFDFYERAMLNHLLGQQDPASAHGHVTYFTPLNPGGRRGVGPAWGGGTWSTDYDSFWCCQGTGFETNTKFMDSIYAYDDDSSLYVNLFIPSILSWTDRNIGVIQETEYPLSDTTTLTITNTTTDPWTIYLRIPSWVSSSTPATILLNGEPVSSPESTPGSYTPITRVWTSGDVVTLTLPMSLRLVPANDAPETTALAYGPVVLGGDYGDQTLGEENPTLNMGSVVVVDQGTLEFEGTVTGEGAGTVALKPFYELHGVNYVVYWTVEGELSG